MVIQSSLARRVPAVRIAQPALRIVVLCLILGVVLYPLAWMLTGSFKSQAEIVNNLSIIPRVFTPRNYPDGWTHLDTAFGRFFLNSAVIAGLAVIGNCASCLFAAYAFARLRFRARGFFFAIMIGTL